MDALETILRRDRAVILASLTVGTLLAWAYLLHLWFGMRAMSGAMPEAMDMSAMIGCTMGTWSALDAAVTFAMWSVMMVGMMLPSAAPMILMYARVGQSAARNGKRFAPAGWFAAGYVAAWTAFSLLATGLQWGAQHFALLTPMMTSASRPFSAVILIAAGLYQFTPLKRACLTSCQSPFAFIQRHGGFRPEARAAFALGTRNGLYCIGCCWALMALLFVAGIMNLLWIAVLAAFVLVEKVSPYGRLLSRIVGAALIAAGLFILI
jgi:predicted metal-binding membrane protein